MHDIEMEIKHEKDRVRYVFTFKKGAMRSRYEGPKMKRDPVIDKMLVGLKRALCNIQPNSPIKGETPLNNT